MEVRISFELNLSNHVGLNISGLSDLRGSLQNISSMIHNLHLSYLDKLRHAYVVEDLVMREALIKHYEADIGVTEQLFNNYIIEGRTEDGHDFISVHKEVMMIDGVELI